MPAILLFLLFVVGPILELVVIIQVGQAIGAWLTVGLLVALSLVGAALVRREGLRAWWRFNESLQAGRVPTTEVADGALVLLGGALLVTPGFLTDALGLALLVPPSRALIRGVLRRRGRFLLIGGVTGARPGTGARPSAGARRGSGGPGAAGARGARGGRSGATDDVVEVEVVKVERDESPRRGSLPEDEDGPHRG